jgi:hypothetical protein
VVTATAAVIASDASDHLLSGFWREHSMLSAIVSGLLFIAIGVLVVDDAISALESRRWRRVQRVVWRSLTVSLRRFRSRLSFCVTGDENGARATSDSGSWDRVKLAAAACGQLPPRHDVRVRALIRNPEWVGGVRRLLVEEKDAGRELLARWAPLMLASGDLAGELEKVAELNDDISDLERQLRLMQEAASPAAEQVVEAIVKRWTTLFRSVIESERALAKRAGLEDAHVRGAEDLALLP